MTHRLMNCKYTQYSSAAGEARCAA
jgi:hypothetical protein